MATRMHRNNGFKQFYPALKEYGNKFQNETLLESLYDLFVLCGYNAVEMNAAIQVAIDRIAEENEYYKSLAIMEKLAKDTPVLKSTKQQ